VAKSVAQVIKELISAANKSVQGKIDDALVIAASKQVTATTAQLVSAMRSKSEPGWPSNQLIDISSKEVLRTTRKLTETTRSYLNKEEQQMIEKAQGVALSIKAEMEQQAKITRLENDLEREKKVLFNFRKQKYNKNN